jgi:hypothetical protein
VKLWLTKCDGGRYMLTALCPTIARIRGTTKMDAFERVGEPINVKHLCEPGIKAFLGVELEPLEPTKIEITGKLLSNIKKNCNAVRD